jgi:hypothetical protein
MRTKPFCRSLVIFMMSASVALLVPQISHASVIYSEAVSGDLPGDQNFPKLVGAFIAGTNTILGHDSMNTDIGSQGDTFGLTLGVGQHIDSILLTLTNNTNTAEVLRQPYSSPRSLRFNNLFKRPGRRARSTSIRSHLSPQVSTTSPPSM